MVDLADLTSTPLRGLLARPSPSLSLPDDVDDEDPDDDDDDDFEELFFLCFCWLILDLAF